MRFALLLTALMLPACAPDEEPDPEVETALPSALPEPGWSNDAGDLVLHDEDGAQLLRLGCSAGPPVDLIARFGTFDPIGSEERVSLGLGEDIVTMVAEVVGAEGPGLIAATRYTPALGRSLSDAGTISAVYGTQQVGPVGPPNAALIGTLLARCAPAG